MQRMVELWDFLRAEKKAGLQSRILWSEDFSGVRYTTHPALQPHDPLPSQEPFLSVWIATQDLHPERFRHFTPGDVVAPALYYIQEVANKHMAERIAPRLLWNKGRTRVSLHMVPDSLIGAIWLQFARAVEGEKNYRNCALCQRWYEVSPQAARKNRIFCSNACRVQSYRDRKARAIKFHHEGREVSAIAAELNTEPETVQGWIDSVSSQ